jgi:hypothetical protein
MKHYFCSALLFGLLLTSCAPHAELSYFTKEGAGKEENRQFSMMVKHQIQKIDGRIPQTRIVNVLSGDTVLLTEKTHFSEIKQGELIEFTIFMDGFISKIYRIDTRKMRHNESVTILVKPLEKGFGSDTLGVIVGGDEILPPNHFNNQPMASIHQFTQTQVHP